MRTPQKEQRIIEGEAERTITPLQKILQEFFNDRLAQGLTSGTLSFYHHRLKLLQKYCDEAGVKGIGK